MVSFAVQILLTKFHLFIFAFISIALGDWGHYVLSGNIQEDFFHPTLKVGVVCFLQI